jgi:hypothetical protein
VGIESGAATGWPAHETQKLTPTDAVAGDGFGGSVAISADTVVVGSMQGTSAAAYVFERDAATGWPAHETRKLTPSGGATGAFGASLAISADVIVVNAPGLNALCVFERDPATGWPEHETQKMTASDGGLGTPSTSVAVSGDTIVAGAPRAGGSLGRAYVFQRDAGSAWPDQETQVLSAAEGWRYYWGWDVAVSDEVIAVSSPLVALVIPAPIIRYSGAVYIYRSVDGVWTQQGDPVVAPGAAAEDYYGFSIAVSGDALVAGAPLAQVGANAKQGAAYVIPLRFALSAAVAGGHGVVSPSDDTTVTYGQTSTYTFTPEAGYHVDEVTVDGDPVELTGGDEYTFPPVVGDHVLSVTFAINTYVITPSVDGGHGSIDPATPQTVVWHATPTFTFRPDAGYHIGDVRVDGNAVTLKRKDSFTLAQVQADHAVVVTFAKDSSPSLGAPRVPQQVLRGELFTVSGRLWPQSAGGRHAVTVRVFRHVRGAWKLFDTCSAPTKDSGGHAVYTAKLRLGKTGEFRLRAFLVKTPEHPAAQSRFSRTLEAL